ncbi:MAG: hypothetical protein GWP10_16730 [Nitrospiraceae bacterium]|nr:hypothetical protein [Nitrospiraceae bacterium]
MKKILLGLLFLMFVLPAEIHPQSLRDIRPMNSGRIITSFSPWGTFNGNGRGWHLTWNVDEQSLWEAWVPPGGTQDIGYHGVSKMGSVRHPTHGSMISYWYGVKNWKSPRRWIYPSSLFKANTNYNQFVVANGCKYPPVGKYNVPLMKPLRTLNYYPPIVSINGTAIKDGEWKSTDKVDNVDIEQNPAEYLQLEWTESIGITVQQKWYQYVNRKYMDFVLCDMKIINNGLTNGKKKSSYWKKNQILNDFWFGIGTEFDPAMDDYASGNGRDDQIVEYYGDKTGDSLRVMYFFDGDSKEIAGNDQFDPRGGPNGVNDLPTGEFCSPFFCGVGILHVDNSTTDPTDNPEQPTTTRWQKFDDWLDPIQSGKNAIKGAYDFLTGMDTNPSGGYHQPNPTNYEVDPNARRAGMLGFGPYNIGWGDTLHIVFAIGVSSISEARAIELGWKVKNEGYDADSARKEIYEKGRANLFKAISSAKRAYEKNYVLPKPPKSPNLYITSGPQKNFLRWDAVENAVKYRVYGVEGGIYNHQVYSLLYEGNDLEFTHENLARGVSYYYYITAVDANGLESSQAFNRVGNPVIPFRTGIATLDSILVVPNPFNVNGGQYDASQPPGTTGFNFSGGYREQNQILFVNLPEICTIRIYNSAGDLIKTIEHTSGSADEMWNPSITDYHQYPASGIYFYTVEAKAPPSVAGKIGTGKFVIIR